MVGNENVQNCDDLQCDDVHAETHENGGMNKIDMIGSAVLCRIRKQTRNYSSISLAMKTEEKRRSDIPHCV
jgi:hypothetical protein